MLRARARRRREVGHRGRVGWDSARNSAMERESWIVIEREGTVRVGTQPAGVDLIWVG